MNLIAKFRSQDTLKYLMQFFVIVASLILLVMIRHHAFADATIIEAGDDKSSDLGNIANMIKTLQIVSFTWIARLIGGGLAIYGIYKIAFVRESLAGTTALVCGGAMFFVQKILESLTKLAG